MLKIQDNKLQQVHELAKKCRKTDRNGAFEIEPKWVPCLARVCKKSCLAEANSLPRTLSGSRRVCHVRLASSGPCQCGIGLSSGPSYFSYFYLLDWAWAHCDNMVQAQRPGEPIIRHQVPQSSMSIACDVVACSRYCWTQVPLHYRALFVFRGHIKCVLSQRAFDVFCEKFHIPEEVHPVLPDRDSTMHERPAGKIGLYTRFFDFANFRLPLSTFLVDILRYFRINISQLSVIGAAKVSHFEILCRVCGITPTVGLFRCFYVNSKKNGWMSFIKRSEKSPGSRFEGQDYVILVDHPSPFRKFPEEFLCLVGLSRHYTLDEDTYMGIFSFIHTLNPTKVQVVERERHEGKPRLLEVTAGRTVPLLPVAPDREQEDSAGGGDGRDTDVQPVATAADTISEDVVPLQPSRHRKRKIVFVDTGVSSHPPKKLREDYETPGGPSVAGKSRSAVQRLLAGAILNAEVEREGGDHIDSVTGLNLRTVSAPQRFIISLDSSHHSGANIAEAEVDSFARPSVPIITVATTVTLTSGPAAVVQEKTIKPLVFAVDSSSAGGDPNAGVFSDLTGSDFLVSGIRTVIDPEFDLQKVYVPQWSVTNGSRLDDGRVCREMVDEFAPPKFFASIRGMDHDQLFTEFNADLLKVGEGEIESLRAQLFLKEAEATEVIRLRAEASSFAATEKSLQDDVNALNGRNLILKRERDALDVKNDNLANQVHKLETSFAGLQEKVTTYENCMEQLGKFQDERMKIVSDKLEKLDTDLVEISLHLEEKFYPHLLTVIVGRSKAIEKGMQDGLAVEITHGQEGRVLTDVAAYNPSAEANYISTLQQLQSVNFSLLAELKSNKDASVETVMKILRLEESLAERLGLTGSQPHVDQLMVPIHHSPDQHVVGASALSLSLDVSSSRVRRIKENISHHRSALRDVFVPLSEPLSTTALTATEGTSEVMPVTIAITMALSVTSASTSLIYPISTDDYEVAPAAGQEGVGADANPFPDDAELNIQ
ncbi:hypothetical protein Tco_0008602 [Tanacetum coccineum]